MSRRRLLSNLLIMGASQVVTLALSFIYTILTGRYFGPGGLGQLLLAAAVVTVVLQATDLGIGTLITRTVARAPERTCALVSAGLIARAFLVVPIALLLFIYIKVAHPATQTGWAIWLIGLSGVLSSFSSPVLAAFQGHSQMSFIAVNAVLLNGLQVVAAAAVIALRQGVAVAAGSQIPIAVLILVLNLRRMQRYGQLTRRVSGAEIRAMLAGSLGFWASAIFLTIYIYIDSVILASMAGSRAVGLYGPPTRLFSVALFAPSAVGIVTLPLLSRLNLPGGQDFLRMSRTTFGLLFVAAVPLSVGLATLANPLLLVIYGQSYRDSVPVLVVLALCLAPMFWNMQFSQTLNARDQQWRWTAVMAASCVANPLINWVMIPIAAQHWHNGALGAALALLATETVMACYGMAVARDIVLCRAIARYVAGATLAGAGQLGVVLLIGGRWISEGRRQE